MWTRPNYPTSRARATQRACGGLRRRTHQLCVDTPDPPTFELIRDTGEAQSNPACSQGSRACEALDPRCPARIGRAGHSRRSVAAAAAVGAEPDQAVALPVLVVEKVGEDRGGEARIVELEAQIVAALAGALGPGSTDLSLMRFTA